MRRPGPGGPAGQVSWRLRRDEPALTGSDQMTWLASAAGVLAFRRGDGPGAITVMINLSAGPVPLPLGDQVLLSSALVTGVLLPPDTGVWLKGR